MLLPSFCPNLKLLTSLVWSGRCLTPFFVILSLNSEHFCSPRQKNLAVNKKLDKARHILLFFIYKDPLQAVFLIQSRLYWFAYSISAAPI